jgi:hypothetical protein
MELIQSLFRADIESDRRDPVISFKLSDYGTIGLLAPHPTFWLRMAVVSRLETSSRVAPFLRHFALI